jgi:hypothetical protein
MNASAKPSLHLNESLDGYLGHEIASKGWYGGAVAELPGGKFYPLTFYDPVRLAQEVESEQKRGNPCAAEPALVVVPQVSETAMRASVEHLYAQGWFEHLAPSLASTPQEALRLAGAL